MTTEQSPSHSLSIMHLEGALADQIGRAKYVHERMDEYIEALKSAQAEYDAAYHAARSIERTIAALRST